MAADYILSIMDVIWTFGGINYVNSVSLIEPYNLPGSDYGVAAPFALALFAIALFAHGSFRPCSFRPWLFSPLALFALGLFAVSLSVFSAFRQC